MLQTQPFTQRDIPRLLQELREQVQAETRRPVSPVVNRLSDAIETAAMSGPKFTSDADQWSHFGLSQKEAELANLLRAGAGKTVHREVILSALYGDDLPQQKILDVWVCKINKKLAGHYRIENEYGVGFRMAYLRKGRDPRDVVEWRGIFMGAKQALMAERLYETMGRWAHTRDLAKACNSMPNAVGSVMRGLRHNLKGTPYKVENVRSAGYRMLRINAS